MLLSILSILVQVEKPFLFLRKALPNVVMLELVNPSYSSILSFLSNVFMLEFFSIYSLQNTSKTSFEVQSLLFS